MNRVAIPTLTGETGATFSDDGVYRYDLWRRWGPGKNIFVVIGLNPSTADAQADDPTIRRCISFARREGCDQFVMLNLFALRSTNPDGLYRDPAPVGGAANDHVIWKWWTACDAHDCTGIIVAAWGNHPLAQERADDLFDPQATVTGELKCLGVNKNGSPKHPLYVKGDAPLVGWREARQAIGGAGR